MNQSLIDAAREAGALDITMNGFTHWIGTQSSEFLERFATIIRRQERERCAKVCEDLRKKWINEESGDPDHTVSDFLACAAAIRAMED